MADYVFTLDKAGYHNEMLVSETLIDSDDATINAALPTAKPGDVIKIASGAKKKRMDLDRSWKTETNVVLEILAALPNKANLVGGKVPSSELPSYIDEATEGYYYDGAFYEDEAHTTPITPSGSIIYVDIPTRRTYRWTGTGYLMIDDENALYVVPVVNMTTMGELRAYIDGINEQGLHVLLDFRNYIGDAFVCTVHLFDDGGVHYCEMLDAVNIQSVVKASYVDTDTIAAFVAAGKSKLATVADIAAQPTFTMQIHYTDGTTKTATIKGTVV